MDRADKTIFFARVGDKGRFENQYHVTSPVKSHALNAGMLGSGFGQN